ncbi:Rv3235 family protein [Actinomadura sp. NPDC047616]|uniref:Rv3235 family protein n=1 Tax=Actinomadura sp. NPDC047616 TaxID=3155914 RepID=UPI0033E71CE0
MREQFRPTDGALALRWTHEPGPRPVRAAAPPARGRDRAPLHLAERPPQEELRGAAAAIVHLVTEVLAGTRTLHHLSRRAAPEVCHVLAAHPLPLASGARTAPPRVLTTWLQEPAPDVAETGAVVVLAGHVQALALRLERHRGRWRCTALETTTPPQRAGRSTTSRPRPPAPVSPPTPRPRTPKRPQPRAANPPRRRGT